MANGRKALGAGDALRKGFEQAISQAPATLFLFLSYALGALIVPAGMVLFRVEAAVGYGLLFLALLGSFVPLLRALALGAAVREASLRMRGLPADGVLASAVATSQRAFSYLCFGFFIELLVALYRWAALLASGGAYVATLVKGSAWGFFTSAGFAFALTVCVPLGLVATLWIQMALARAVARDEGYLASLYDTAGTLWARPWPALLVVAVTGVLGWGVELMLSLFTRLPSAPGERGWALLVFGQLVAGVLSGFVWAVLESARLDGLAALELDAADLLPRPAAPPAPEPPPAPVEPPPAPPEPTPGLPTA